MCPEDLQTCGEARGPDPVDDHDRDHCTHVRDAALTAPAAGSPPQVPKPCVNMHRRQQTGPRKRRNCCTPSTLPPSCGIAGFSCVHLNTCADIQTAAWQALRTWACAMPVAAAQLVLVTAAEDHALVGGATFASALPLAASGARLNLC